RPAANTWTHYELKLSDLGMIGDLAGIVFQDQTGGAQPTYYLDSVQVGSVAVPTPGPSPTSTPLPPTPPPSGSLPLTINTNADRHPISPLIYGANQDFSTIDRLPARRIGGNRTTGYNWENNASNAGSDFQHYNDAFM